MDTIDLDTGFLVLVEFSLTIPCEHKAHGKTHVADDHAVWDVHTYCPRCETRGHYTLCASGHTRMQPPAALGCTTCGLVGAWHDFIVVCNRIPEAA